MGEQRLGPPNSHRLHPDLDARLHSFGSDLRVGFMERFHGGVEHGRVAIFAQCLGLQQHRHSRRARSLGLQLFGSFLLAAAADYC